MQTAGRAGHDDAVTALRARPLGPRTWADFAGLAERHGGVWGGCWCLAFHGEGAPGVRPPEERRRLKEERVRSGRAHAALVYAGERCVGWCQFGSPDELPRIKRRRAYEGGQPAVADWRITCFFVDPDHRRAGVAEAALVAALAEIARLGGGRVESFPEQVDGAKVSSSFLHNATLALFERHGFEPVRPLGARHWLVAREVAATAGRGPAVHRSGRDAPGALRRPGADAPGWH